MNEGVPVEGQKTFERMNGREKVEHIRGRIEHYNLRVRDVLEMTLQDLGMNLQQLDAEANRLLTEAFEQQVETYLVQPDTGGGALEHLAQGLNGVRITQEQYGALNEMALALAAQFAQEAKESSYARELQTRLGGMRVQRLALKNPKPQRNS